MAFDEVGMGGFYGGVYGLKTHKINALLLLGHNMWRNRWGLNRRRFCVHVGQPERS